MGMALAIFCGLFALGFGWYLIVKYVIWASKNKH
jgi:hypothetical protein